MRILKQMTSSENAASGVWLLMTSEVFEIV